MEKFYSDLSCVCSRIGDLFFMNSLFEKSLQAKQMAYNILLFKQIEQAP
jgi:hypothetical protein